MINQRQYEHYAQPLIQAAEDLQLQVAAALRDLWRVAIKDPGQVTGQEREFKQRVEHALHEWTKAWQYWTGETLAQAYAEGIKHTDAELAKLREQGVTVNEPTGEISPVSPLKP